MILNCPKFETCEPCERRADPRIECHLPCVLEQEGRSSQSIVLANLSGGGAMIRGHFGLMPRDRITIRLVTGTGVSARVVWVVGDKAGTQFDQPLELPCHLLAEHCLRSIIGSKVEHVDTSTMNPEICQSLFKKYMA